MAGYCRLWIPGFAELAAPLYPLTKPGTMFQWEEKHRKAFQQIKKALLEAPALGLPDLTKPFELFVDENSGYRMASMPPHGGSHCRITQRCRKTDPGTTIDCAGLPCSGGLGPTTTGQMAF